MEVEFISTEFLEIDGVTKLALKYKATPSMGGGWVWVDASTGAPLKSEGVSASEKYTTLIDQYTTLVDDAEFTVPKHLVCEDNAAAVERAMREHFMAEEHAHPMQQKLF